jgi:hypothetical protein
MYSGGNVKLNINPSGVNMNGNVGIGTTNPGATLDVRGNISCTAINSLNATISVTTSPTNVYTIGSSQSGWLHLRWYNGTALYFFQWYYNITDTTVTQIYNNARLNTVTATTNNNSITLTASGSFVVYYTIQFLT